MQFSTLAFMPVAALLASTAYGAECYSQGHDTNCLNRDGAYSFRQSYCGGNEWQSNGIRYYTGSNGFRGSIDGENLPSQQSCWDSTQNIIDQCIGHKNGGFYTGGGWNVNFNFCT
ncbi:hypothetical protein M409DRAFT_58172 [Zasmidium cellare ATCC 36951]|uniref:Cyanovirin-N domain-containing protein n=1 Tax=Zasmidium cellare ATCC 36951 TaxID=1080233 RepID=A0A6A6CAV6_ZASCE|nr:uncharacterized protein M409DRAFT_58172 [Zasmidium cellare ATCC 36951]KAF2162779.1 hypothetical protein M409DRAFT_58172 [Zasmidium cellare ATCC 36951]